MYRHLFSEMTIRGLTLKNRLTMAPLYLGYAGEGGTYESFSLPEVLEKSRTAGRRTLFIVIQIVLKTMPACRWS